MFNGFAVVDKYMEYYPPIKKCALSGGWGGGVQSALFSFIFLGIGFIV